MKKISTGLSALDRALNGGVSSGSVITLNADPRSQVELMLHKFINERPGVYITTQRWKDSVQDDFENSKVLRESPNIIYVGDETPVESATRVIRQIPEGYVVIIDSIDVLEEETARNPMRLRRFMNVLQNQMRNSNSVAYILAFNGDNVPANRDITNSMSDIVMDLETKVGSGNIENVLAVLKYRRGRALDETLKFTLRDTVAIDTSRDIA